MADWIGHIAFDPATSEKLRRKHNLTDEEVVEAVAHGNHDRAVWDDEEAYGERLVLTGSTYNGRRIIAYLRPIDRDDGTWECMTAWER